MIATDNEWCNGEILEVGGEKIQVLCAPVWFRDSCDCAFLYAAHGSHVIAFDGDSFVESLDGGQTWGKVKEIDE